MADFAKAKQKIDKVIFSLWRSDAVMFGALSLLDKIPSAEYDTMGISISSGRVSLRFNPNFVNSISIERLELVLVIEGMRVLLRHPTTRLREPGNISQLASSLSINQLMNSDLEALLGGLGEITPAPERFGLPANNAFEEYFRGLLEKQQQTEDMINQIWSTMTDEEKQQQIQNAVDKANAEFDKKENNADEDNYQQFENEQEAMKAHTNPNGNANQGWGKNNGFDADVKQFVDKVKNRTKMWGRYTGTSQAQIMAAIEPKVDCRDIIRRFGSSVMTGRTETSRLKINRRWDIERPGYRRVYQPHVIFAIDVSGSMSDEDLAYGLSTINRLLHFAKITFVQFDTEIKSIERSFQKARKTFKIIGRGGTDFEKIMDLADNEKVDGLIVYTDGYAPAPHKPKCRVLWLMSQKDQKPPVSWGYQTYLNRFSDNRI
ncbi:MAG: VWA-like domain-containing protein [Petrotogales bacterium]